DLGAPFGGSGYAGENLEQGGLAGAVAADDADDFALTDLEGNVLQRPDVPRPVVRIRSVGAEQSPGGSERAPENVAQGQIALALSDAVALAQAVGANGNVRHQKW